MTTQTPAGSTSPAQPAAGSDRAGQPAGTLADLLDEQSPRYAGLTTNEAERSRASVLAGFATSGLPPAVVPFVLEELETGRSPSTVAAAGRALRGAATIPAEAPELLVAAISRLRGSDDVVSFAPYVPGVADSNAATALVELAATLAWLGPRANRALPALRALVDTAGAAFSTTVRTELVAARDALSEADVHTAGCCGHEDSHAIPASARSSDSPTAIRPAVDEVGLENQDGLRLTFAEAFAGRTSALAFFYTRCTNPEKCSLTVTRLARLASLVAQSGLDANVAGMSYDPGFDRPGRLRTYGADRGMVFSPRCALLRTRGPFDPIREAFDLGVGFGPVTVNRHRLDVVVLDASLHVAATYERRLWHEDTVFAALRRAGN